MLPNDNVPLQMTLLNSNCVEHLMIILLFDIALTEWVSDLRYAFGTHLLKYTWMPQSLIFLHATVAMCQTVIKTSCEI